MSDGQVLASTGDEVADKSIREVENPSVHVMPAGIY